MVSIAKLDNDEPQIHIPPHENDSYYGDWSTVLLLQSFVRVQSSLAGLLSVVEQLWRGQCSAVPADKELPNQT